VAFLVDTGVIFPLAISASGWQKAGVDPKSFEAVAGEPNLKQGVLPRLTLGAFDLPRVPAVSGLPLGEIEQGGGIHLDGVVGSALIAEFRVSLVDQGRTLWLEEMPVAAGGFAPPEDAPPSREPRSGGSAPPRQPTPAPAPPAQKKGPSAPAPQPGPAVRPNQPAPPAPTSRPAPAGPATQAAPGGGP
jgi:hypothetical protein